MIDEIYLDNAATTKPADIVINQFSDFMINDYYNPSSLYKNGIKVKNKIKEARQYIANLLCTNFGKIIYVASATEANNFAIFSATKSFKANDKILITSIEHPSVSKTCEYLKNQGINVDIVNVDESGIIDFNDLKLKLDDNVKLICAMHVNNEIGSVNDIKRICECRDKYSKMAAIHIDGVQGFTKNEFDFRKYNVQSYCFSSHKIHGPKGIAVLALNPNYNVSTYKFGGGQEFGLSSGTENVYGILGLDYAIKYCFENKMKDNDYIYNLKILFYEKLKKEIDSIDFVGPDPYDRNKSSDSILMLSIFPLRSDVLINALSEKNIFCSSGSACNSFKQKISHTLKAMHYSTLKGESAVRFSFSYMNDKNQIEIAVKEIAEIYKKYSVFTRR